MQNRCKTLDDSCIKYFQEKDGTNFLGWQCAVKRVSSNSWFYFCNANIYNRIENNKILIYTWRCVLIEILQATTFH